jgi:hypothetical protein
MRITCLVFAAVALLAIGCGKSDPVTPSGTSPPLGLLTQGDGFGDNHQCWAFGLIQVNDDHTRFDWVPLRQADFHLNAVNLLENGPNPHCVTIQKLTKMGNGVVEVEIGITHPFPGLMQYTGFDVKGIIMFNGSISYSSTGGDFSYRLYGEHPELFPIRFNVALAGDWELLNEDGFSFYWSPAYVSGGEWPMFNYIEGKFSNGLPNSVVNAYKDFYTTEERHMFLPGYKVVRTYRIQTQPGPMTLGYAVDACWEPPIKMPVIDPAVDFPSSANQPEPYVERYWVNDDEPITKPHTEVYSYPYYVQLGLWDTGTGLEPENVVTFRMKLEKGKWKYIQGAGGGDWDTMVGPVSGSDDVYEFTDYPFSAFGKYNGYYVVVRYSYHTFYKGGLPQGCSTFNPSIQVIQVAIPGNDPP